MQLYDRAVREATQKRALPSHRLSIHVDGESMGWVHEVRSMAEEEVGIMAKLDAHLLRELPMDAIAISSAFEASRQTAHFQATLAKKRTQHYATGVLSEPVTVVWRGKRRYLLVDGYCSYLFAQERGVQTILARVYSPQDYSYAPSWMWRRRWQSVRTCTYCGGPLLWNRPPDMPEALYNKYQPTRDHVVPRASGGSDDAQNLKIACRRCNEAKGRKRRWAAPKAFRQEAQRRRAQWIAAGWIRDSQGADNSPRR